MSEIPKGQRVPSDRKIREDGFYFVLLDDGDVVEKWHASGQLLPKRAVAICGPIHAEDLEWPKEPRVNLPPGWHLTQSRDVGDFHEYTAEVDPGPGTWAWTVGHPQVYVKATENRGAKAIEIAAKIVSGKPYASITGSPRQKFVVNLTEEGERVAEDVLNTSPKPGTFLELTFEALMRLISTGFSPPWGLGLEDMIQGPIGIEENSE